MSKYKITKAGKKAQELGKKLEENQRLSLEEVLKIVGEDVYKNGNGLLWTSVTDKNKKITVKRDPISERK